jgi:hypothetical protein
LKESDKEKKATGFLVPSKPATPVLKDKESTTKDPSTKDTLTKDKDPKTNKTSRLARPTTISAAREAAAKAKMQERERKGTMATIKSRISSMMPRKNPPPPPPPYPKRTSSLPLREKEKKMKMEQAKRILEEVKEIVRLNAPGETSLLGLLEEGVIEFEKVIG